MFRPEFWKFLKTHFDRLYRHSKSLQCRPKHSNPDFDFIWNFYSVFCPTMAATDKHKRKKIYLRCPFQLKILIGMVTADTKLEKKWLILSYWRNWLGGTETKNGINVSINLFLLGQGLLIFEAWRLHPDTPHLQETDVHVPGGIGTRNPSKRASAGPHLRTRDKWDRLAVGH
jgi:hypothetical protein